MEKTIFTSNDFNLPVHLNELQKAEEFLLKLKTQFKAIQKSEDINDNVHMQLFEEIIKVLDYLGRLSMPTFAIREKLETRYVLQYTNSPALAKKLFTDHYESLHHPYDVLKNKCFRFLDELDVEFITINKRNPKNWKI